MEEINLHGVNHEDVDREIDAYLNNNWSNKGLLIDSFKVITGHSTQMRKEVIKVLDRYGLGYKIGGDLGVDDSYMIVYND
jgi:hypothetical protein